MGGVTGFTVQVLDWCVDYILLREFLEGIHMASNAQFFPIHDEEIFLRGVMGIVTTCTQAFFKRGVFDLYSRSGLLMTGGAQGLHILVHEEGFL